MLVNCHDMHRCLLLFLVLCLQRITVNAQATVWVKGYVTYTQKYCGGAAPSPELLASLNQAKPLAHKIIYVKKGAINSAKARWVAKISTDDSGRFALKLRVGQTYSFVEEWKGKSFVVPQNTSNVVWDIQCLRQRYAQADYVLKVNEVDNNMIHINYLIPCFYAIDCGTYMGPLPP